MFPISIVNQYGNTVVFAKIKKVSTGLNHITVLAQDGTLYGRGRNNNGQLGQGDTTDRVDWTVLKTGVKDVWCNQHGILLQNNDGSYMCAGQMRLLSVTSYNVFTDCTSAFSSLPSTSSISQMVFSSESIMIMMTDNSLWGIGPNSNSELAGTGTRFGSFVKLTVPTVPTKIFGGYNCMAYIDASQNFYYSGIIKGTNTSGGTTVSSFSLYNPAGSTALKVFDFTSTQYGCFFLVQSTNNNNFYIYAGGSEHFGQLANNANSSSERSLAVVATIPFTLPIYRFFSGYPYYSQHVVTQNGVYAAGQNNTSSYIGKMGAGSTANLLTYTLCPLPNITDFSKVQVFHCFYRTYIWDGSDTLYGSGQNTTYSNITPSTSYIIDSPVV